MSRCINDKQLDSL